jgi:hypothetical protein
MKNFSRLLLAPMLAAVLLLACIPTNAARRVGASPYDGSWSVAIYTLRGDCGSVRVAARIVGGRVYSADQSYQANGGVGANGVVRVAVAGFGRSASAAGCRTTPAQDVGGRRGEDARVVGQPRDAQAIRINRDRAVPRQGRNCV